MSPKGHRHEMVKKALQQHWIPLVAGGPIDLITETTLCISEENFLEPEFLFWPRAVPLAEITARSALLVVEIADTRLGYDLGRKASIFAGIGLREYWVIDASRLETRLHREPQPAGFHSVVDARPADRLAPALMPALAVSLAGLGLGPIA